MSANCLRGVWTVSGGFLEGVWNVSGGSLEDSGDLKQSFSRKCLDIVRKVSGRCLKGVWRVSGECLQCVWRTQMPIFFKHEIFQTQCIFYIQIFAYRILLPHSARTWIKKVKFGTKIFLGPKIFFR